MEKSKLKEIPKSDLKKKVILLRTIVLIIKNIINDDTVIFGKYFAG